jgi:hypothetical protein
MDTKEKLTLFALRMGMAVPFLYFGIQIVAAPFYPQYSFLSQDASTLGSDGSSFPSIFNIGSIITGIFTWVASWGFLRALQRLDVNPILAWLTSIAIFLNGLGSLWAGFIPLPDPRHGSNPFVIGVFLLPALLAITLWKQSDARLIKTYLVVTNLLFVALIPIMSGLIQRLSIMAGLNILGYQSFLNNYQGLLQRIAALIFFPPIGIGAYFLAKRIKDLVD